MNQRDIFHAAVEITDPAERSALLEKACGGDPSLQRDVERMLQVYPRLGTFLESPAVALDSATAPPLRAGRFQLGHELARGGMGIVYSARDESLGRDVAVKVLHERYLVGSLVGQRFLDEARITAQLQHPGIPPVFEVGRLEDERPYLAMKLIKGRTLEDLLKERAEPESDRGRFVAVFEQICQAVGYAHSKHILHRDLKPANVMVGAFGEVQVMDWGLAKLLPPGGGAAHEPAAATQTSGGTVIQTARPSDSGTLAGSMLGTPAFLAPEQAGGELDKLDERTDVFGLGAILCVILTGEPPYTGKSGEDVRLLAVHGKLADAHARLDQCGADAKLVELCRACLSAEREARPRDAGAVAATIAGYLAGVEERARQAELERAAAEVRAAEQRKRRRVQLALAATLLVLLGLVGFGLWWQERLEATTAAELAERNQALQAAHEHERLLNERARQAIETVTSETAIEQLTRQKELRPEQKDFLDKMIRYYAESTQEGAATEEERSRQARAYFRMGRMNQILGRSEDSENAFRRAVALGQQLAADFPTRPELRQELAGSHNSLGILLKATGRLMEAELAYGEALAIHKRLAADFPSRPEFRQALAGSHNNLGGVLADTGRLEEAVSAFTEALTIRKQLAHDFPTRDLRRALAMSHNNLGFLLHCSGRLKEAESALGDGLALQKQLAADFPDRPELRLELAKYANNLGDVLHDTRRLKEAVSLHTEALAIQKQLVADFPNRPEFRQELASGHNHLGILLRDTGRLKEAEAAYAEALAIYKRLAADFPRVPDYRNDAAGTLVNLAIAAVLRRDFAAARQLLGEAFPYHQAALQANPRHPAYRQCYRNSLVQLTLSCAGLGDRPAALAAATKRRDLGWDHAVDAYEAAWTLARCIPIVEKNDALDTAKRQAEMQLYADQAMAMLRDAVAKGYKNIEHMRKNKDLDPLRERLDFKKRVAELERAIR
jgi:serine/threonine protein kinase